MTGAVTPNTGVIDLMAWASRLLGLVVDGFGGRGVPLPHLRYVSPGALPAYDTEQVTVNLGNLGDGRAGGGLAASIDPYSAPQQYIDLIVSIIRNVPENAPIGTVDAAATSKATGVHLRDLAVLRAVLLDIRSQQLLTLDAITPMQIPYVRPDGPSGGVVAAVAGVSIQIYTVEPPL